MNTSYELKLAEMWQESSRDFALKFLRDAVDSHMCLQDLSRVLDFEHIRGELHSIRLREVVGGARVRTVTPAPAPEPPPPQGSEVATILSPRRRNKVRRGREQTVRIEELVRDALQGKGNELATDEVAKIVRAHAQDVEMNAVALVLKGMEKHGLVVGDRSRPRRWRWKMQGRRIPEPIVIRKGAVQAPVVAAAAPQVAAGGMGGSARPAVVMTAEEQPAPVAAVDTDKPVALMTQAEVEAAADRLRERFFSTHKR